MKPVHIPESHRALLNGAGTVVLSTRMPDGQPQVTPIWCNLDGDDILINTMRGFRKERNLRADPRVTLLSYELRNPLHNIEVRGQVIEMCEAGAVEHLDELTRLYMRRTDVHFFGDCVSPEQAVVHIPVRIRIRPFRVRVEG